VSVGAMRFKAARAYNAMPLTDTDFKSVQTRVTLLFAAMMLLVPAIGWPNEDLLQDTLKSMLVAFFVLSAVIVFFWQIRNQTIVIKLHGLFWLPVGLMVYALFSTAWSHAYLGSVEAIRWFVFSLLLLLGMNTLTRTRMTYLAWGVHVGAVVASLWTALQFWFDLHLFAQGRDPASTFVNRNFFAEYIVCTLPFSVLLLTRLKDKTSVFLMTFSLGFNITALMMTGTRSALLALFLLLPSLPCIVWLVRKQITSTGWRVGHCLALAALLIASVLTMGSISTGNAKILSESKQTTPIERALFRTASLAKPFEYTQGSFSVRTVMWKATARMIAANPIAGVGAGAWEAQIPVYQTIGSQLETDYYAHNEFLQLVAEYGITGWLFLLGLLLYLALASYRTWANRTDEGKLEAPVRALALSSLFALVVVSNAGFPWRMAATGAMFALSLAVLAASDLRLYSRGFTASLATNWKRSYSRIVLAVALPCSALAVYLSQQAIECENKLMRAVKMAVTISSSGKPNDTRWNQTKTDMLELTRQGIAINPHYRKLTPIVADSLAAWGDWNNALWIWESVLASRPHVVGMISNVARGYVQIGNFAKAQGYLDKARAIQPTEPTLASLQVTLWSRSGREHEAALRAKELLQAGVVDRDLVQTAYVLGARLGDTELAIQALEMGIKTWPERAVDGWLRLGAIYAESEAKNEQKAIESFKAAMDATPEPYKTSVLARIPPAYRAKIL
jgi:O-antigen ligase